MSELQLSAVEVVVDVIGERTARGSDPRPAHPSDTSSDDGMWCIQFRIRAGPVETRCTVSEPYLCDPGEWFRLIDGADVGLELYQGNGEGAIRVRDGVCEFCATPSGSGGDVSVYVSVPVTLVAPKLAAALERAVSEGVLDPVWRPPRVG